MTVDRHQRTAKLAAAGHRPGAPRGPRRGLLAAVVAAVVLAIIAAAVIAGQRSGGHGHEDRPTAPVPAGADGLGGALPANPGPARPGAPVLELFADYQCPNCANLEKALGATLEDLAGAGKVRLFVHTMSFLDRNLGNDSSTRAAAAAACAADAGRFLPYHAAVMAGQPAREGQGFTDADLGRFATDAGITGAARGPWETCVASGRYAAHVTAAEERSERAGVFSTPTLRLNGQDVPLAGLDGAALARQVEAATKK